MRLIEDKASICLLPFGWGSSLCTLEFAEEFQGIHIIICGMYYCAELRGCIIDVAFIHSVPWLSQYVSEK